jgi:hypothetical protein
MIKFKKEKSSTAKFLEIVKKNSKKVWLRSEKVDPKRCSFSNGQRHISIISIKTFCQVFSVVPWKLDTTFWEVFSNFVKNF